MERRCRGTLERIRENKMTPDCTPFETQRLFSEKESLHLCSHRCSGCLCSLAPLSRRLPAARRSPAALLFPFPAPLHQPSPRLKAAHGFQPLRAEPSRAGQSLAEPSPRRQGAVQHCGQRQPPAEPSPAQPDGAGTGPAAGCSPPGPAGCSLPPGGVCRLWGGSTGPAAPRAPRLSAAAWRCYRQQPLGPRREPLRFFLLGAFSTLPLLKR